MVDFTKAQLEKKSVKTLKSLLTVSERKGLTIKDDLVAAVLKKQKGGTAKKTAAKKAKPAAKKPSAAKVTTKKAKPAKAKSSATKGTPKSPTGLRKMSVIELKAHAKDIGMKGYSRYKKDELVRAIIDHKATGSPKQKLVISQKKKGTPPSDKPLSKMLVSELRKMCKDLGVPRCLTKDRILKKDLIELIEAAQRGEPLRAPTPKAKTPKGKKASAKKTTKGKYMCGTREDPKCPDKFCDITTGKCLAKTKAGGLSKRSADARKGMHIDEEYGLVGPYDDVQEHLKYWGIGTPTGKKATPKAKAAKKTTPKAKAAKKEGYCFDEEGWEDFECPEDKICVLNKKTPCVSKEKNLGKVPFGLTLKQKDSRGKYRTIYSGNRNKDVLWKIHEDHPGSVWQENPGKAPKREKTPPQKEKTPPQKKQAKGKKRSARCTDKDDFLQCDDGSVCKSDGKCVPINEPWQKKQHILTTPDGREIYGTKAALTKLKDILGGTIKAPKRHTPPAKKLPTPPQKKTQKQKTPTPPSKELSPMQRDITAQQRDIAETFAKCLANLS